MPRCISNDNQYIYFESNTAMKYFIFILFLICSPFLFAGSKLNADILFDWAENSYTSLFPSNQNSTDSGGWYYRYYHSSGNALGLHDDGYVYVLGDTWSGLVKVASLDKLMGAISTFDANIPPISQGNWYKPKVGITWYWQLQGNINSSFDVNLYDIDLFDSSSALIQTLQKQGKKVICYFSAGSWENWRPDADEFLDNVLGYPLDDWKGEKWLDISNEEIAPIMRARLDLAVDKGCDGVEPDNMDGYTNETGFALTANMQLAYNKFIANEARKRGLSVALKNNVDQIKELEPYFDFSINESCHKYNECEKMSPFIYANKPVLNAEYDKKYISNQAVKDKMCLKTKLLQFQTLILPLSLDGSYKYNCD